MKGKRLSESEVEYIQNVLSALCLAIEDNTGAAKLALELHHDAIALSLDRGQGRWALAYASMVDAMAKGLHEDITRSVQRILAKHRTGQAVAKFVKSTKITAADIIPNIDPSLN